MQTIHQLTGRPRVERAVRAIPDWRQATLAQKTELMDAIKHSHRIRNLQRYGGDQCAIR
jgi:hypothetical protein